jgi:predicted nucleic acid-binding protein
MSYVYDASFVAALIIPDEKNPRAEKVHYAISEQDKIFTPQLIWYEMTNVFMNLLRRKRFTNGDISGFFLSLASFRLTTDFETGTRYSQKLLQLCNEYNLSSYDAAYLELAERKKAALCTLDNNLSIAAKKHGVTVLGID